MGITEEVVGEDVYRLALTGRMDVQGVAEVEGRFAELTAEPRQRIIVDMAGVPFVSSVGIRTLLIRAKAVVRRGGRFVLLSPDPRVHAVLETAGVAELLRICATLDDAVAGVRG